MDNKPIEDLIIEIMQKKQFKENFEMVALSDLSQEVDELIDQAIEQLQKQGKIYKPRHHFLKLTERK